MRVESNGTLYNSFQELASAWGLKPVQKITKDKEKLKGQQDKFLARHKCLACGEPLTYLPNTNVMSCTNEKCLGLKRIRKNEDGTETVYYVPSFHTLDEVATEIASNIL